MSNSRRRVESARFSKLALGQTCLAAWLAKRLVAPREGMRSFGRTSQLSPVGPSRA